ncbi:hypothetical protein BN440_3860 [Erwinia amylovora MR1]|nr:hypothetical protein BN440_3860 [Erwinia amylovora MR1]
MSLLGKGDYFPQIPMFWYGNKALKSDQLRYNMPFFSTGLFDETDHHPPATII